MPAPRRENNPKRTITPAITNKVDRGGHVVPTSENQSDFNYLTSDVKGRAAMSLIRNKLGG